MKLNNFRGDLIGISAKKEALLQMCSRRTAPFDRALRCTSQWPEVEGNEDTRQRQNVQTAEASTASIGS